MEKRFTALNHTNLIRHGGYYDKDSQLPISGKNQNIKSFSNKQFVQTVINSSQYKNMGYEPGPPIDDALVPWLNEPAEERRIQLPVEIHGRPQLIEYTVLRGDNTESALKLDTGAMSVDLPTHLRRCCKAYPCPIWLEGTWGSLIPGSSPSSYITIEISKQ